MAYRRGIHVLSHMTSLLGEGRLICPLMMGWVPSRSNIFALLRGAPVGRNVYRLMITKQHSLINVYGPAVK